MVWRQRESKSFSEWLFQVVHAPPCDIVDAVHHLVGLNHDLKQHAVWCLREPCKVRVLLQVGTKQAGVFGRIYFLHSPYGTQNKTVWCVGGAFAAAAIH